MWDNCKHDRGHASIDANEGGTHLRTCQNLLARDIGHKDTRDQNDTKRISAWRDNQHHATHENIVSLSLSHSRAVSIMHSTL